jgi:hypothetical protein
MRHGLARFITFAFWIGVLLALSPVAVQALPVHLTQTAVTSSLNPSAAGQSVTFTATVAGGPGSGGSVTFNDGSAALGTVPLTANNTVSFSTSSLAAGNHTITAHYGGFTECVEFLNGMCQLEVQILPSLIEQGVTQVVNPAATTTTLTSSVNPGNIGQPMTFTATVTAAGGFGTPTGTVTFLDGATALGAVALSGNTASLSISSLATGSHAITAVYGGNASFTGSTSPVLAEVVRHLPVGVTVTLTSSVNPSNAGQPVTFTATVTAADGGPLAGTVAFVDRATTQLGAVALSGNTASLSISSLAAGTHEIIAVFTGNAIFNFSSTLIQVVRQTTSATTTTLSSSVNPSNAGQPVTFTATVTTTVGAPAPGAVTFRDGAAVLAVAPLVAGVASFTTSSLTLGVHSITASYNGSGNVLASTSMVLMQTVQAASDSVRLRALEVAVTKVEAQSSGNAFAGAVAGAIADGFSEGGGALIAPSGDGLHFNFAAEPDGRLSAGRDDGPYDPVPYDSVLASRTSMMQDHGLAVANDPRPAAPAYADDAFAGLAYARPAAARSPAAPSDWQLWADVRGAGWNTDPSAGDIRGGQINAIFGLTRRLTPDFLVGVLGGYENFDYTSQTLNGRLRGDGWTVGGYLGWRILPGVRLDAAVGRSGVGYDGVSGFASGSFPGERWMVSGGLTGMVPAWGFEIEPSATVYAVWEHDSSFIDSLGSWQADNTFSTGRASAGVKAAWPMMWSPETRLSPYVGLYADYYFSSDNATVLLPNAFVQGFAARTAAGLSFNMAGGVKAQVGGEVGGLGSQNFATWTVRGRISVPF